MAGSMSIVALILAACGGGDPAPPSAPEVAEATPAPAPAAPEVEDPLGFGPPGGYTPPTDPVTPLDDAAVLAAYEAAFPERQVVYCDAGAVAGATGPLQFRPIDPWLPAASGLLVTDGRLTASAEGPHSSGVVYAAGAPVARLIYWGAASATGACRVQPLEAISVKGKVVGDPGMPQVVRGCRPDQLVKPAADGAFELDAYLGQKCRPQALVANDEFFGWGPMIDLGYLEASLDETILKSAAKRATHAELEERLAEVRKEEQAQLTQARSNRTATVAEPGAQPVLDRIYANEDAVVQLRSTLTQALRAEGRADGWAPLFD